MILRWFLTAALISSTFDLNECSPSPLRQMATVAPDLVFQQTGMLPKEHQVSIHLMKDEIKRVVLRSERAGIPLSVAVTPCSSTVAWSVRYTPNNNTASSDTKEVTLLKEFKSDELETFKTASSKIGQYIVELTAIDRPSDVQLFASSEPVPPHTARMAQMPRMRLQRRQRRKRLTVKWDQSPIDPHVTEYCLVVSSRRNYTSLCEARGDRAALGFNGGLEGAMKTNEGSSKVKQRLNNSRKGKSVDQGNVSDVLISCVGARTHHTVDNLEHGKMYYFNLFAVNKQNNLTFPYGSTFHQYDQKIKQSRLKDGKPENVNLKKLDGKAVFRFKAGKQTTDTMLVSIMPCGGSVDVEILLEGRVVMKKRRINSYERLLVPSVKRGQRYIITVIATNREELRRTSAVEVLATTKQKFPLPELPNQTEVREFDSLKSCDSVTVGWMPSPDPTAIRYCVVARESRRREAETRAPDQCALETRLRKSASSDSHLILCRDWKIPNDKIKDVMTQRIRGLRAGRRYVIQVTVKKSGGKTLSYDLLTVHTKSTCT